MKARVRSVEHVASDSTAPPPSATTAGSHPGARSCATASSSARKPGSPRGSKSSATVAPARDSISRSRSTKRRPRRIAASRPRVVLPEPMNPASARWRPSACGALTLPLRRARPRGATGRRRTARGAARRARGRPGRRAVRAVGLDARDVELPQPTAVGVEELVSEGERRVVRPHVGDVEAEPGLGEGVERLREVADVATEPLGRVHVLEDGVRGELADPSLLPVDVRVEDDVVRQRSQSLDDRSRVVHEVSRRSMNRDALETVESSRGVGEQRRQRVEPLVADRRQLDRREALLPCPRECRRPVVPLVDVGARRDPEASRQRGCHCVEMRSR